MTDDDITKTQQAVDRTLASIKAACESYIGAPLTRESVETAASKALSVRKCHDYEVVVEKAHNPELRCRGE